MKITHEGIDYVFDATTTKLHTDLTVRYSLPASAEKDAETAEHWASVSVPKEHRMESGKSIEGDPAERIIGRLAAAGHLTDGLADKIREHGDELRKLANWKGGK